MSDPVADPKLKQAREEIEAVLSRYDIAAVVVLHNAPDRAECFLRLTPTYSRLFGGPTEYRLRSKLADYGGDTAAQKRDLEATANMLMHLATLTAETAIPLLALSTEIDGKLGSEHGGERRHQPDPPKGAH